MDPNAQPQPQQPAPQPQPQQMSAVPQAAAPFASLISYGAQRYKDPKCKTFLNDSQDSIFLFQMFSIHFYCLIRIVFHHVLKMCTFFDLLVELF